MKLLFHRFQLETKTTFKIARVSYNIRKLLVVELQKDSWSGIGEASDHSFYQVKVDHLEEVLENFRSEIEAYQYDTPENFWDYMNPFLKDHPFAQCALDVAAHDLFGKIQGKPLYQIWGKDLTAIPKSVYTLGIDTPAKMVEKLLQNPWSFYKIKLGVESDLEIVEALRANTSAPFMVDANCGWSVEETLQKSKALKKLGVKYIEQPLHPDDDKLMEEVFQKSELPIFADESCRVESDVEKCQKRFHGINIKLMKCGGITPARKMIQRANALGLQVMGGCMMESSIGISALAHLLPDLDYVDMDSILLIKKDVAGGVKIKQGGEAVFPNRPGTGAMFL